VDKEQENGGAADHRNGIIRLFEGWLRACRARIASMPGAEQEDAMHGWQYQGRQHPPFAIKPAPGQESVWDYPRPPIIRPDERLVEVRAGNTLVATTRGAVRVLETGSPPTFYLPPGDVCTDLLEPTVTRTFCEWKGQARYYGLRTGDTLISDAAWCYPEPSASFAAVAGWFAFYPARLACFVDGERVRPQAGEFYGGWITRDIAGPFKGGPGTSGW
jgi:uncharacterized protein (DUF427 family)